MKDAHENLSDLQDEFYARAVKTSGSTTGEQTTKYLRQFKMDEILNKINYSLDQIKGSLDAFPADLVLILNERKTDNFERDISFLEQDIQMLKAYYECFKEELPSANQFIKDKAFALNLLNRYGKIVESLEDAMGQSNATKSAIVEAVKLGIVNEKDKNLKNAISLINDFDTTRVDLSKIFKYGINYTYDSQDKLADDPEMLQAAADAGSKNAQRRYYPEPISE